MRTYELMVVLDPRSSEDDTSKLIGDIKSLVEDKGAEVIKLDLWGRRKLAYEIQKLKEGYYALFYLSTEDGEHGLAEAEQRLKQHDLVLRYMLIRTDDDLRRAGLPLPSADDEEPAEGGEGEAAAAAESTTDEDAGDDSGEEE